MKTCRKSPVQLTTLAAIFLITGLHLSGSGQGKGQVIDGPKDQEFEAILEQIRIEHGVPALAAAFVKGGRVTVAAVGFRKAGEPVRVSVADRFHVGSVSKPVSATVIARLVERGSIRWDTTVAKAFPDIVKQILPTYRGVTLEQLLSHRAGILPFEEDDDIAKAPVTRGTPKQQRSAATLWLLQQTPVAKPGTEHVYSNAGYAVAAAMVEKATGREWEDLVLEHLARPLGMSSLGFGWPARQDAKQPWGHQVTANGFAPHPPNDAYQLGPLLGPAGDMHMNIIDLARFAQLHLEGLQTNARLLSARTFRKLHTPIGDYGLGWNVRETANHHLGGAGTFSAAIWVSVPRNTAIVVLCNADANEQLTSSVINGSLKLFGVPKP